ncbi:hypothetical protein LCGC14_1035090 [marine sediment metagenome]|uniref:Uncharacterized protein n=1 Tax=marine sediment metagenome TaxID=412755 RepID=A0A0F9NF35_9ZZZZ
MAKIPDHVFDTILAQIGRGVLMSIGARDFVTCDDQRGQIIMRVGAGRKLEKVTVTLTDADDYTVRYAAYSLRGYKPLGSAIATGVYCDQLGDMVLKMGEGRIGEFQAW